MVISLPRDANRVTVIGGVSSADGSTVTTIYVDPTTHRILAQGVASFGTGAPGSAPTALGQTYINTATGKVYMSTGTSTAADWTELPSASFTNAVTTGAQTINTPAGSVLFAPAASSLVVTNSLVTTASVILATVATNDGTLTSVQAVAGNGSFTLFGNSSATAQTRVCFFVVN